MSNPTNHPLLRGLILDESQKAKNPQAKRTQAALKLSALIPQEGAIVECSGTPIRNRPIEFVPQLKILGLIHPTDPKAAPSERHPFGGEKKFKNRYCWRELPGNRFAAGDYNGARNLTELNDKLRQHGFLRRVKADVLPELPAIQRGVVPTELDNAREYDRILNDFHGWMAEQGRAAGEAEWLVQLGQLRQAAAKGKTASMVAWAKDFIDGGDEKLILFAYHKEAQYALVNGLREAGFNVVSVTAEDIHHKRHIEAIDAFQNDPSVQIIVCSQRAAQTGITLTAASNVAFLELDWSPVDHDQAEARCYGRVNDAHGANAYYFVGLGTIDEKMMRLLDRKRQVIAAATDGGEAPEGSILSELIAELKDEAGL